MIWIYGKRGTEHELKNEDDFAAVSGCLEGQVQYTVKPIHPAGKIENSRGRSVPGPGTGGGGTRPFASAGGGAEYVPGTCPELR
jgi:hypothetical protein